MSEPKTKVGKLLKKVKNSKLGKIAIATIDDAVPVPITEILDIVVKDENNNFTADDAKKMAETIVVELAKTEYKSKVNITLRWKIAIAFIVASFITTGLAIGLGADWVFYLGAAIATLFNVSCIIIVNRM